MQKSRSINATIALIAFVLMVTIIGASFTTIAFADLQTVPASHYWTQTGPEGHPLASEPYKRSWYNPLPAWMWYESYTGPQPGPSPWYAGASSGWARYNVSNSNYNDYSTGPKTAHIRWIDQYSQKLVVSKQEWGYNFREGPRDQQSDSYSGMLAAMGYIITWMDEDQGRRLRAVDEWTGKLVWETKLNSSIGDQPFWLLNDAGGPIIYCKGGTTLYGYGLQTGNMVDKRTFPINPVMYYNSSKFGQLDIGETALFAPGGVVYGTVGGSRDMVFAYCMSWDTQEIIWGPTPAPGGINTLVDDVLCGSSNQIGEMSGIDAITGELLWQGVSAGSQSTQAGGYGMFYVPMNDGSIHAFNARTGHEVWVNRNITASYWNEFFMNVGDGKVFDCNRDGNIYCLDAHTGEFLWSFFAGPSPYEPWKSYYGTYGFHIVGIGGGSSAFGTGPGIYSAAVGDESIGTVSSVPGNMQYVLNVETGELLFKYPGGAFSHNQHGVVADGNLVVWNPVMDQVICFGKGDTKIDLGVTASQIASGGSTWITGRITDQSPAHPGTPCVSEDSMEAWMTYIHGAYPAPPAGLIEGVELSLVAVDSANNVIDLGTVTSDSMGYFKLKWTPPNEEMYQITASFAEDGSYYSSWAVTDLAVGPAAGSSSNTSAILSTNPTIVTLAFAAVIIAACACTVSVAAIMKMRKNKGGNNQ